MECAPKKDRPRLTNSGYVNSYWKYKVMKELEMQERKTDPTVNEDLR